MRDKRRWLFEDGRSVEICNMTLPFMKSLCFQLSKRVKDEQTYSYIDKLSSSQARIWQKTLISEIERRDKFWKTKRWKSVRVKNARPIRVFK